MKHEIIYREEGPFSALTSPAIMASAIIYLAIKHRLLIQRNISVLQGLKQSWELELTQAV